MDFKYSRLLFIISLILTFFFQTGQVFAAPVFVQGANGSGEPASIAFTANNTAGNTIIACLRWGNRFGNPTISDSKANSYSVIATVSNATLDNSTRCWVTTNILAGANTVTTSDPADVGRLVVAEFSGLAVSSALDQTSTASGNSAIPDGGTTVTTAQASELIFGFANNQLSQGLAAGSGFSTDSTVSIGGIDAMEWKNVASIGVYNAPWTSNSGQWSAITATFKSAGVSDTTPPSTPSNLSATAISSSAINLSWTASSDNVGVTKYTIYRGGVQIGTSATNSYSDSGLIASTAYTYTISAQDAAGNNSSQSSSASATTQAPASDTTPPSTPTGLFATAISSSSINLTWTASTDNVAVTGYKVFRGGVQIGTSATNSYSDSGLTASTNYSYSVSAYDAASNVSSQSSSASATTQSAVVVTGTNLYISQNGAGSQDASSCANAKPVSFFNTSFNWASSPTSGKISPSTTVHLCGTFTGGAGSTMLTTQGSGASGNPITILFEPGAVLTAPYWSTQGALQINHNYILVDGGTPCGPGTACAAGGGTGTGLVTATANTESTNHTDSEGIVIGAAGTPHDIEIKNMAVTNMCVRFQNEPDNGCSGSGIRALDVGNNLLIHDSTIHDVNIAIFVYQSANATGNRWYNMQVYNRNEIARLAVSGTATVSDCQFYGWDIGDSINWDDPSDNFHHDGFHLFETTLGGHINGCLFYNNYFHANMGVHSTSGLTFFEVAGDNLTVFNNYIAPSGGAATDGLLFCASRSTHCTNYNNTIVGTGIGNAIAFQGSTNGVFRNNIVKGNNFAIYFESGSMEVGHTINNNLYYNNTNYGVYEGFTTWKATSGYDVNSTEANPLLNSNGTLQSGSPAISGGANLTSLGITALNSDKAGVARPSTGSWDIGAYYVGGGTPPPPTPVPGDLNLDHVVNTLDFSLLNSKWLQSYSAYDLYVDNIINSLDYAIMSSNWGKTW